MQDHGWNAMLLPHLRLGGVALLGSTLGLSSLRLIRFSLKFQTKRRNRELVSTECIRKYRKYGSFVVGYILENVLKLPATPYNWDGHSFHPETYIALTCRIQVPQTHPHTLESKPLLTRFH